jgi:uncharacterized protein DUF5818
MEAYQIKSARINLSTDNRMRNRAGRIGVTMKKIALSLAGALILFTVACNQQASNTSSQSSAPADQSQATAPATGGHTFSGEIMDSMCAGMGGHEQMLQGGKIKNAKECTLECAKMGAKYVLYNPATKTTYELDDQKKPEQFAAQKVTVTGSLDAATKTIHVENIEAAKS